MTDNYVEIQLPGDPEPRRRRLLGQAQPEGPLPRLQIVDFIEYLVALRQHADGSLETEVIWNTDDRFDGRCLPVTRLPDEEVRSQLRRFFGDDPRAEALMSRTPLR